MDWDAIFDKLSDDINHNRPEAMSRLGCYLPDADYLPLRMSPEMERERDRIVSSWPRYQLVGDDFVPVDGKAFLWDIVQRKVGKNWLVFDQKTGSCVGNGFGQTLNYRQAIETWVEGQAEEVPFPWFWLYPYGRSRVIAGLPGPGEGSFGAAIAEAAKEGCFAQTADPELPAFSDQGGQGLTWGARVERDWSFIRPNDQRFSKWKQLAAPHPITTTALLKNADEVRKEICSGRPVTCASNWGGQMQCRTEGTPPVLINRRTGNWAHQMCIIGWWDHPSLKEIFYILNSWGTRAHGKCPSGAPEGGFWVRKAEIESMCRERFGELIAYTGVEGYVARPQIWSWRDMFGPLTQAA